MGRRFRADPDTIATPAHGPKRLARATEVMAAGLVLTVLIAASRATGDGEIAATQRGFPPNGTFQVTGLDNVNLFNGNVTLSIPVGPDYPIGAEFSQQVRMVYNAQVWRPEYACQTIFGDRYYGMYTSGLPTFGTGWSLDFGHVSSPAGDQYVSPDGAAHPFPGPPAGNGRVTVDATYTRIRNIVTAPPYGLYQSASLDFADGQKASLAQRVDFKPAPGVTPDFNYAGLQVTRLYGRFGDSIEINYATNYEVADGAVRIANVKHYQHNLTTNADTLLRTILFHYTSWTVDNRPYGGSAHQAWTVLSGIDFPTVSGTQKVRFVYSPRGFGRPANDMTSPNCQGYGVVSSVDVAAPLLQQIQLEPSQPSLHYDFEYLNQLSPRLLAQSGVLSKLTVPTGGVVAYTWEPGADVLLCSQFSCDQTFYESTAPNVRTRTEYPDGTSGTANVWTYSFDRQLTTAPYYTTTVVAQPDGYASRHYFHLDAFTPGVPSPGDGLRYVSEWLDLDGSVVRKTRLCYEGDGVATVCDNGVPFPGTNVRESLTTTSVIQGGSAIQTKQSVRSGWNGYGDFATRQEYDWDGRVLRTTQTTWTPNTGTWLLDLFSRRTTTDAQAPAGEQAVDQWFEINPSNGFLTGTFTHDAGRGLVLLSCRYPDSYGDVRREFSASYTGISSPPAVNTCSTRYPGWPTPPQEPGPVIGLNGDAFGKEHTYQNGRLSSTRWVSDNTGLGWPSRDETLDAATGVPLFARDTAGLSTGYTYDLLARPVTITPPGDSATQVSYDLPTQVTVSRTGTDGNATFGRAVYDGFGRVTREIRLLPGPVYALRTTRYDSMGRRVFLSEWTSCSTTAICATASPTQGRTWSQFDPLGRAQSVTSADGQVTHFCYRNDPALSASCQGAYGDTLTKSTTSVSGSVATTLTQRDALGRVTSVTEPSVAGVADVTTYVYNPLNQLAEVHQGIQTRLFKHDAFGFLRSETTPERGTMSYEYGSVGNVLKSTTPDNLLLTQTYDPAARLLTVVSSESGAPTYVTNTYDDPAAGPSGGKLTRQVGTNGTLGSVVDSFLYDTATGRPWTRTTQTPSGTGTLTVSQRWYYNSLGLISTHFHPRPSGAAPFAVSTSYDAGRPVSVRINGIPAVNGMSYRPHGGLAAYRTGVGIGHDVTTTVVADPSSIARPSRIVSSEQASGATLFDTQGYTYDGAGNILGMGSDSFGYDGRSRITSASLQVGSGTSSQTYGFDRYGNLVFRSINGAPVSYPVDAATNHLSAVSYTRGNVATNGGESFAWDALDRLVQSTSAGTWKYLFDAAGERVAKVPPAAGAWTLTFRDGGNHIASEFSGAVPARDDIFVAGLLLGAYANCAVGGSCLINGVTRGPWQFYASDHLGTPRLVTDLNGNAIDQRKYWPFGDEAAGADSPQRLKFASMERDQEGSRYYDHARSHDFSLGRFLSPDPVAGSVIDPQSWNGYAYVRNRPMALLDPSGRQTEGQNPNWEDPHTRAVSAADDWYEQYKRANKIVELIKDPQGTVVTTLAEKAKELAKKKANKEADAAEKSFAEQNKVDVRVDDMGKVARSEKPDLHVHAANGKDGAGTHALNFFIDFSADKVHFDRIWEGQEAGKTAIRLGAGFFLREAQGAAQKMNASQAFGPNQEKVYAQATGEE